MFSQMYLQALARERQAELLREAEIARMKPPRDPEEKGRSFLHNLLLLLVRHI